MHIATIFLISVEDIMIIRASNAVEIHCFETFLIFKLPNSSFIIVH
jgi:hypothetical protein